jgi:hypothetical protein
MAGPCAGVDRPADQRTRALIASNNKSDDVYLEVINMNPALVTADIAQVELCTEVAGAPTYGRFSTGMEQLPETPAKARIGRFSDGMEQLHDSSALQRVGRFSAGMELSSEAPETLRVGSFADGQARS